MNIFNWRTKGITQYIRSKGWTKLLPDYDYKTTDDLDLVLSKKAKAFISGNVVVADANGEPTGKELPKRLTRTNPAKIDYRSMFERYSYLMDRYGVARFYVRPTSYYLLEEQDSNYTFKSQNILSATDDNPYRTFTYSSENTTVDLLADGGEIVTIYETGFDHSNHQAISKTLQIEGTIKLSATILKAQIGAFVRSSMLFLFKKGNGQQMPLRASDLTAKGHKDNREAFNDTFDIQGGSISMVDYELGAVDANPDNKRLDSVNIKNHALERICGMMEYPYKMLIGDTKFDDLRLTIKYYYLETMVSRADRLLSNLLPALGITDNIVMDYSNILDLYETDKADTTSTMTNEENE